jgi:F-box protein 9
MKDEPEKLKLPSIDETKSAALSKSADDDDDEDSSSLDQSPLWHREDEGWELTWPIWHMLPRDERKALAKRHGYNTIGEFEEYMSLQTAVDETDDHLSQPYSNESVYSPKGPQVTVDSEDKKPAAKEQLKDAVVEVDRDEDDESESGDEQMAEMNRMASTCTEDLSPEELMELGGKILILPDEILHRVFSWLPVDAYGILALVSPHWKHLTRTESVYRRLCERLYLNQSKKRQLHVSKFGNSYRKMLELRPRVRAAGGCYVLKYSCVKPIQRDMWTEVSRFYCLLSMIY